MAKNTITEDRYNKIKPHVSNARDDVKNMEKYGIGRTVIRDIRNTNNFEGYKLRGSTHREHIKKGRALLDACERAVKEPRLSDELPSSKDFFSGRSLPIETNKRKRDIIDIIVLVIIGLLFVSVLLFGGK